MLIYLMIGNVMNSLNIAIKTWKIQRCKCIAIEKNSQLMLFHSLPSFISILLIIARQISIDLIYDSFILHLHRMFSPFSSSSSSNHRKRFVFCQLFSMICVLSILFFINEKEKPHFVLFTYRNEIKLKKPKTCNRKYLH